MATEDEGRMLRSAALQSASSLFLARQRAERELIAANQALRDSNARLHRTLDAGHLGDWDWDAATDRLTMGPRAAQMFGLSAWSGTREQMRELIHAEDRERVRRVVNQAIAEHTDYDIEYRVNRRTGGLVWVAASGRARYGEDGTLLGINGVLQDVTDRKRAEELGAWLAAIVESSDDAIIGKDLRGIVTSWNRGAEKLFGYAASEIIGESITRLIPPEHRTEEEAILDKIARGERVRHFETGRIRKDGSTVDVSVAVSPIRDAAGIIIGASRIARDVTERRHFDQVLQEKNAELESARSEAERANRAKSDFVSSMSHEVRAPLHAILGFAQLMEVGEPPPTPSQQRNLGQILKGGWYLLSLINEILDLALVESGRLVLAMEAVSLAEIVTECRAMVQTQAQTRDVRVAFSRFDVAYLVSADRTRLKQVLVNLLSNAIKYNRVGGVVEVDCMTRTPGRVRICVRDSGEGLAPEALAQLFLPFNRLGRETGGEEGSGIGLVITKRLVELMNGEIGVESTPGVGSVFWIDLNLTAEPRSAAAAESTAPVEAQPPAGAPCRTVLCVEDNAANLMLIEDLIALRSDLRLLTATDGTSGIECARISRPDVILMDINLPGIGGVQALGVLRADPATAHIPVIALSANAMPQDIDRGLECGFFRYVTKPIRVDDLLNTLDLALQSAQALSEPEARSGS